MLNNIIKNRRAVFPNMYNDKEITKETINQILENANWAPTHRRTEPWLFKVIRGKGLEKLSQFLGDFYQKNTPAEKFSPAKLQKTLKKPLQSSCVIAICMQRDPENRLPEWEEIAAVACAVQNMWLTCTDLGIGSYWSSPKSINTIGEILPMQEGERCLGLFYMGYYDTSISPPGSRTPIGEKVIWVD